MTRSSVQVVYGTDDESEEKLIVTHLERVASILGALLIGVSAYMMASNRAAREDVRRRSRPVEDLEADLRSAWAGYHNR